MCIVKQGKKRIIKIKVLRVQYLVKRAGEGEIASEQTSARRVAAGWGR